MFDLRNIICPIEHQIIRSRFISNSLDVEMILINAYEEMKIKCLDCSYRMIELIKENYFIMLTGDSYRYCQLNVTTFTSISYNVDLILIKVLQTKDIFFSFYSSNEDEFLEEIKKKLNKHFVFVKRCVKYIDEILRNFQEFINFEFFVVKNYSKPSSIEKKRRKIEKRDIQKLLFDQCNRGLENIISTFDQDHLEDKNGHVGKELQSLRQLLASGFD